MLGWSDGLGWLGWVDGGGEDEGEGKGERKVSSCGWMDGFPWGFLLMTDVDWYGNGNRNGT